MYDLHNSKFMLKIDDNLYIRVHKCWGYIVIIENYIKLVSKINW